VGKENIKLNALKFFVFIAVTFFYSVTSYPMDAAFNENDERNWRASLNVYDNDGKLVIDVDAWLEITFSDINEGNEEIIRGRFSKKTDVGQNNAVARFTIICNVEGHIRPFSFNLNKIFVSGLNSLNLEHPEVKGTNFQEQVIFPVSFISGPRPSGQEINRIQQDKINQLLGKNVVNSGTDSEESILIYIASKLPDFIGSVSNEKFTILGTLLEISSLKDPCSEVCVPMLKAFMENIHIILRDKIPRNVHLANKLENLVLLSGRLQHRTSRSGIGIRNEMVKLNFEAPSNRVYSRKSD
jgi:hypothetical protein